MNFRNVLSRIDEEIIEEFVGSHALRLMRLLDPDLASRAHLLDLILQMRPPASLLTNKDYRNHLIDLLSEQEINALAKCLGVFDHDKDLYTTIKRLRINKGSERERAMFDFFSIPLPPMELTESPSVIENCQPGYSLFSHQRRAVTQLREALKKPPRRAMLHMPTGSGKTRTTMHSIAEHLRLNEPTVVIWLAHSEELCSQAAEEFKKAWFHLGNREVDIYRFWGDSDLPVDEVQDGFMVAGLSKTFSRLRESTSFITELGRKCSLVILDEAHSAIAETYSLILDALSIQRQTTGLLGLTATPGRTWNDIAEDERLARFFNQQKITLQVEGYSSPIDYLVAEGYLAELSFVSLPYQKDSDMSATELQQIREAFDIPAHVLRQLAEDEKRNLIIIMNAEDLARRHSRIILFAATVEHSELLAGILNLRGIIADSITSRTPTHQRRLVIDRFRAPSQDVHILCNFGVLTEGFDAPETSAVLIARPTKSLVLYSQMIGRAIRGPKAGGNKHAEAMTVIDQSLPGFGSIADAFINWEDVWR